MLQTVMIVFSSWEAVHSESEISFLGLPTRKHLSDIDIWGFQTGLYGLLMSDIK